MDFDNLNIVIIDTSTNTRVLEDEFAQASSIKLIYNGADDRLQLLMTSELRFSLLVTDGSDAKFKHLLINDETRYKVVVEVLDDSNVVLDNLWTGFLLPDQFNEPYITGSFFVNFIATDGLGLLKYKYYTPLIIGTETITSVISNCLLKTKVEAPLHIAPAIENAVESMKVDKLTVDNNAYFDDEKQTYDNCYNILERILLIIGSKLFQYNSEWYIVGINRFEDQNIVFDRYNLFGGAYLDTNVYTRDIHPIVFLDKSTNVDMIQSYKSVSFSFDRNFEDQILSKDIVYQPIDNGATWSDSNFTLKYWHTNFNNTGGINPVILGTKDGSNAVWNNGIWVDNPGYVTITTSVDSATIDNNYMNLLHPVFINGNKKIGLKISGTVLFINDTLDKDFSDCVLYEVLFNGVVIISNKTSFTDHALYDFELRNSGKNLDFKLDIEEIILYDFGYLDIRFYAFKNDTVYVNPKVLILHELEFITNNKSVIKETLTRDENLTLIKDIESFHGSSLTDLTNRKIGILPSVPFSSYIVDLPEVLEQIPSSSFTVYDVTRNDITVTHHRIEFTYDDWQKLKSNENIFYLKKGGVGALVKPSYYQLLDHIPGSTYPFIDPLPQIQAFIFDQDVVLSSPPELIESGDEIWIYKAATQITYADRHYLMKDWKLYGGDQAEPLLKILAMLYHNQVEKRRFVLNGEALGLYSPLEYIKFNYIDDRYFIPTALTLDLVNGKTDITMIESTNNEVTNYNS